MVLGDTQRHSRLHALFSIAVKLVEIFVLYKASFAEITSSKNRCCNYAESIAWRETTGISDVSSC